MSEQRGKPGGNRGGGGGSDRGRGAGGAKGGGRSGGKGGGAKGGKGNRRVDPNDTVAQLAGPLRKVLDRLPETQRRVLELRMGLVDGHPKNLTETAEAMGMTMHEAKQVEQRAFEHIREAVPLDRLQKLLK